MNVDQAAKELRDLCWDWEGTTSKPEDDPEIMAATDRLILEVQAAMPCYGEYTGTGCPPKELIKFLGDPNYSVQCPSCTARTELAKSVVDDLDRTYICLLGCRHAGWCLSTHGGSGGTRNGVCPHCHRLIIDGIQQPPSKAGVAHES